MTEEFDVIVIGAGPAGEVAGGRAAGHGLSVAIVERDLAGGECSYWGCMPSKALLRPGDVVAAAARVPGVTASVDPAAALTRRDAMAANWTDDGQVEWIRGAGMTFVRGHGRLAGERTVRVTDAAGEVRTLRARRGVVLATGTTAALPPIPGLADAAPWTNRGATAAKTPPQRLIVLGGGAVGVELAQAWRRLGTAEVTVVERLPRLLASEEPFVGEEVAAALRADGIRVHTGTSAVAVRRPEANGPVVVALSDDTAVAADEILVATGRRAATTDVGLDTVGLTPGEYVAVDDRLRAAGVPGEWLYAVGDVNGAALLTHMGKYQGRLVGDLLAGRPVAADWRRRAVVPRVVFTDPQVAAVGCTEEQARAAYPNVRVVRHGTGEVAGGALLGVGVRGTSQLVVDDDRGVIVGATFTGPGVGELLHAATIAVSAAVPLDELWHAVPAFPLVSEVWLRLLEAYGR